MHVKDARIEEGINCLKVEIDDVPIRIRYSTNGYSTNIYKFVEFEKMRFSLNRNFVDLSVNGIMDFAKKADDRHMRLFDMIKLLGCGESRDKALKRIIDSHKGNRDFEDVLESTFQSFYSSACYCGSKVFDSWSKDDYKKGKEALKELGAEEKIEKLEKKETSWLAESLSRMD